MTIELLLSPCPFCKSTNIARPQGERGYICRNCGSNGFGEWNSRPIEDALRVKIAELEAECAQLLGVLNRLYVLAIVTTDSNSLRKAIDKAHKDVVERILSLPQPPEQEAHDG